MPQKPAVNTYEKPFLHPKLQGLKPGVASLRRITIMIHGTVLLPSLLVRNRKESSISRYIGTPRGLHAAQNLTKHAFYELAQKLCAQSPDDFNLDLFYFFGWSGKLCVNERRSAAQELSAILKKLARNDTTFTIITHSHGGNVALALSEFCDVPVERLILLACPVQDATAEYCASNIFNTIFHIYSRGDILQVLDPQGIRQSGSSLFSRRCFKNSAHLYEASVTHYEKTLWHIDFIKPSFMSALPCMIDAMQRRAFTAECGSYKLVMNEPR